MPHLLRLILLILAGATAGYLACGWIFAPDPVLRLKRNLGETTFHSSLLLGAVLGAYAGMAIEMAIRLMNRCRWRFSLAEILAFTTLAATSLVTLQMVASALRE